MVVVAAAAAVGKGHPMGCSMTVEKAVEAGVVAGN